MGTWGKPYLYAASVEATLLDGMPFADIRKAFDDGIGDRVRFEVCSYGDLWKDWAQRQVPEWLPGHVERLSGRYLVDLPSADE